MTKPSNSEQVIRRLYQITNNYKEGFEYQINELLLMGLDRFNLDIGIFSRIEQNDYIVENCITPADMPIQPGDYFNYDLTYCKITCSADGPVAFEHVGKDDDMASHPAYRALGLESYIGIPIHLNGEIYGTLNFSSPTPHPRKFRDTDIDVLKLMASWIEIELIRREQKKENLKQKMQLEEGQKIAHLGSWEWDIKSNIIVWSDEVYRIFGEKPQSFTPTYDRFLSYLSKAGQDALKEAVANAIDNKETYMFQHKVHHKDGTVRYVQESGNARFDDQGKAISMIGTVLDITKHVHLQEKLKLYKLAVEQSTSGILITDINGLIEYANPHFYKVSGYSPNEITGKSPKMFKSGNQYYSFYKKLWDTITSGKDWHGEMVNVYKNGRKRHELTSISPIKDEEGNIKHFVAVKEDITELKTIQEKLTHQAHFDTLTNLPNRTLFFDQLEKTLAISKRKKHDFALLFIDLDGFKHINDKYGHAIGDQLLIEVSKKIQSSLRESDTVGRIGGDEFVVLLSEISSNDEPGITAERIIDMIMEPFQISGHICHIGASIGISLYPEHSIDLDELLVLADKAMYEVKSSGKNNYHYAN